MVDDGSTDGTAGVVTARPESGLHCRLIRNDRNRGKGYSVRRGALEAIGKYLLISDADLSTPIEEVDRLLSPVEKEGYAMAIASRALPDSRIEVRQGWIRERMGKLFNGIIQVVTGLPFHDTQCGFKLMDREKALLIFELCRIDRFCYDVELIYLMLRAGMRVAEVPVRWRNSYPSRVRMGRDSARMLFDAFRIVAIHSHRRSESGK